ncbi:MAG TPA: hypothetical protein VK364_11215, partial [Hymenobacter sp.]|nr:hypothetical protein [Hymenobacter sp.]
RQSTIQRLLNEYVVAENKSVLESAIQKADSTLLRGKWRYTEPLDPILQNKPILTIADQSYTVNEFFDYVQQRQQVPRNPTMTTGVASSGTIPANSGSPAVAMRRLFNRFVGDRLIATEEQNLDKKSPEFRALISEIHDGVLLSQMMEQHVWERSMADTTGQRAYFEQHKDSYQLAERALASIVVARNDAQLKQATDMLSGKPPYQLRRSGPALVYDRNQTTLTASQHQSLLDVLTVLIRNPDYVVEVTGSHDLAERDSVSAGRIRSVVSFLQQNGISLSRITEKDYQGVTRQSSKDPYMQRTITFQYFSSSKADVARALNDRLQQETGSASASNPAIVITEGLFTRGMNPYLDGVDPWKPGTTILHPAGRAVALTIVRVEPARAKTFAEARGAVINEYQAVLEKQWLAQLRQKYPVKVNEEEIKKLAK